MKRLDVARAESELDALATQGPKAGRPDYGGLLSSADALLLHTELTGLRQAIVAACDLIEAADVRNLSNNGPAGGFPPQMTLEKWRTLYTTLDKARRAAC